MRCEICRFSATACATRRQQLEHNRRLVEEGQLAPIDIVAAETQVANIEQGVYEALGSRRSRRKQSEKSDCAELKTTRSGRNRSSRPIRSNSTRRALPCPKRSIWLCRIVPKSKSTTSRTTSIEIDQRFLREQTKPQIDLMASYSSSGIGGSQNPNFQSPFGRVVCNPDTKTPTEFDACVAQQQQQAAQQASLLQSIGGAGTSFTDILSNKYPTFRVGVQFNLPLRGDKTAQANLGKSLVQGEQITNAARADRAKHTGRCAQRSAVGQNKRGAPALRRHFARKFRQAIRIRAAQARRRTIRRLQSSRTSNRFNERQKH